MGAMPNRRSIGERAARFAALGDGSRLAIMDALATSDRAPAELRRELGIESNLLAHHLDVLERVGLVARSASEGDGRRRYVRLTDVGATMLGGSAPITVAQVLFVCTHNSARSQLAEAVWNAAHAVPAASAGTHPTDHVHPMAVAVAAAAGLALGGRPRSLDEVTAEPELVVTVCDRAHEELTGSQWRRWHWSVPDPARSGRRSAFDATMRQLQHRIDRAALLVRTGVGHTATSRR
jgi:protein-tyrosine-phosphatase/DNA-binding HxlR family transcriptional regulator